jgi:hypothetical protein
MPICFVPGSTQGKDEDDVRNKLPGAPANPEWREPPGYLGEAVRRAKRITSAGRPDLPAKSPGSKDR